VYNLALRLKSRSRMNKEVIKIIRARREVECFPIVNRGKLWYETLTQDQTIELRSWYYTWLNAPETGIIPQPPSWINQKLEREEILL